MTLTLDKEASVPKTTTPTYRPVRVTPDLAREWLKRNTHNRPINKRRVTQYAKAMKRGEWRENGDTFKFSTDGQLLDGQTRLSAVLESGVTIDSVVVEGLTAESQLTMDNGQPRTLRQHLQLLGLANAGQLAATARLIYDIETGQLLNHHDPGTMQQMVDFVERNKEHLVNALRVGEKVSKNTHTPRSWMATAYWLFEHVDRDDADEFMDLFATGEGLVAGNPIYALRKWVDLSYLSMANRGKSDFITLLAIVIKAWNLWRDGRQDVQILSYKAGGRRRSAETYPVPH